MGLNWSEGLKGLSGGIGMYMQYQSQLEERKYQEQQQAAQQQFQKSLVELQGSQQRQYLGEQQRFERDEAEKDRNMRLDLALQEAERWADSFELDKQKLDAQLEANDLARNDVKLVRELELMKLDYSTAASQIAANNKAAMEQIEALAKDPTLAMNPEAMATRREAILTAVNEQNKPLIGQLQTVRAGMYGKLGMEAPPLGGGSDEFMAADDAKPEPPPVEATIAEIKRRIDADANAYTDMATLKRELKAQNYTDAQVEQIIASIPRGLERAFDMFGEQPMGDHGFGGLGTK